jgi:Fe-S cluster assembly protein SufD
MESLWKDWIASSTILGVNKSSWKIFQKLGYPKSNHERFTYLRTRPLEIKDFVKPVSEPTLPIMDQETSNSSLLFFHNGKYDELNSIEGSEFSKFSISKLSQSKNKQALEEELLARIQNNTDNFLWQHYAFIEDALVLDIPANTILEEPLQIQVTQSHSQEQLAAIFPKVILNLGKNSQAKILVNQNISGNIYVNRSLDVFLDENASLELVRLQNGSADSLELNHFYIDQKANSNLKLKSCYLGSKIMRNSMEVHLRASGAEIDIQGVSVLNGSLQAHNHLEVYHHAPHSFSNQEFAHAALDKGQISFDGTVVINEGASGSNSEQLIKNLILSPDVKMSGKPNLKIFNDDVKCAHGNTCGQLDESEIFYLQSRGFSRKQAEDTLTKAFVEHLIQEIPFPKIRASIDAKMLARLQVGA